MARGVTQFFDLEDGEEVGVEVAISVGKVVKLVATVGKSEVDEDTVLVAEGISDDVEVLMILPFPSRKPPLFLSQQFFVRVTAETS